MSPETTPLNPLLPRRYFVALVMAVLSTLTAPAAAADEDVAAFYRGKTLTITNAFAEGGLYSTLARIITRSPPALHPGPAGGCRNSCPAPAACGR